MGTTAAIRVPGDRRPGYKGLAIAGDRIFATDFTNGQIDVFDSSYSQVFPGAFTYPNLPANYVPFGIQTIGGNLFVTFANKMPGDDEETHGAAAWCSWTSSTRTATSFDA